MLALTQRMSLIGQRTMLLPSMQQNIDCGLGIDRDVAIAQRN